MKFRLWVSSPWGVSLRVIGTSRADYRYPRVQIANCSLGVAFSPPSLR